MAHNTHYADRIRGMLSSYIGLTEREKKSGLTFMLGDKICAWIKGDQVIVRCIPEETDTLLKQPGVSRFTMKGRENMRGWLIINPDEQDLQPWIDASVRFVLKASEEA